MPSSALPTVRATRQQLDRRPALTFAGDQLNRRDPVLVAPQQAPDPPRPGDVPTRPARMPHYVFTAIRAFHAVAEDEFHINAAGPPPQVSMPKGRQEPVGPNTRNINVGPADPFGTQVDDLYAGMP